ncbi:MAG: sugar phosphate isomerase/epimerase family protein [Suipraeoptans sp.]
MGLYKYGVCEWVLPVRGPEAIVMASNIGFDGIQITEAGGHDAGFPLLREEVQDEYKRAVSETNIEIQALHLWTLCRLASMIHPVKSEAGRFATYCIKAGLEVCEALSIPELNLTSGFMSQIKHAADFTIFGDHLKLACEMAESKGVKIVFESALYAEEILKMHDYVGENLKVCYDLFNPIRFNMDSPIEEIRVLGKAGVIDHFHVKDGPVNCIGCSLLGEGIGNYNESMNEISKLNYSGWLMTENYYVDMERVYDKSVIQLAEIDLETMKRYGGDV